MQKPEVASYLRSYLRKLSCDWVQNLTTSNSRNNFTFAKKTGARDAAVLQIFSAQADGRTDGRTFFQIVLFFDADSEYIYFSISILIISHS